MYLSLAIPADVLDHQETLYGARTDGFTMTFYGGVLSGMTGIATGLMNGLLYFLGYSASSLSSPAIRMVIRQDQVLIDEFNVLRTEKGQESLRI